MCVTNNMVMYRGFNWKRPFLMLMTTLDRLLVQYFPTKASNGLISVMNTLQVETTFEEPLKPVFIVTSNTTKNIQ